MIYAALAEVEGLLVGLELEDVQARLEETAQTIAARLAELTGES
jgi:hypothetical protein